MRVTSSHHFISMVFAAMLLCCATLSSDLMAQQSKIELTQLNKTIANLDEDYKVYSIQSSTVAEAALLKISSAQADLQMWYSQMEKECYEKFFVTSCLNKNKLIRRNYASVMQRIEVEAKAFQRREHIEQLDASQEIKKLP